MKKQFLSVFFSILLLLGATWNGTTFAQSSDEGTTCPDITLPWAYGAEETFVSHGSGSEQFPPCWESVNAGDGVESCCWSFKTGRDAHWGNQAFYFKGFPNPRMFHNDWLITPNITFSGNEKLTFWVKTGVNSTSATHQARISIYASNNLATSSIDTAHYDKLAITGTKVVGSRVTCSFKDWQQIEVTLPSSLMGNHRLAFVLDTMCYSFNLDDIYIFTPSTCATPTDVHVTSVSDNSISLVWTSNASTFTVYCDTVGADINQTNSVMAYENSVEITGLTPSTIYEVKVMAECDDGALSVPSYPLWMKTSCVPYSIDDMPFKETFSDNAIGASDQLDDCWYKGSNANTSYPFVKEGFEDTSLAFNSTPAMYSYVVLPEMEEDISNLILSCQIHPSSSANKKSDILLGLVRNPNDISTMTVYDTLIASQAGVWNDFVIPLLDYDSENGHYLAFKMEQGESGEAYLDDIMLQVNESFCDAPVELQVISVSNRSVQVSWTDSIGSAWRVYYDEAVEDSVAARYVDVVSNPATIYNLNPQTNYEFWVATDCGGGDFSMGSAKLAFSTTCDGVVTLPYVEDFESYESGENATIDSCWITRCSDLTEKYPYPAIAAAINGERGLWLQSYETTQKKYNSYAAMPMFNDDLRTLQLRFKIKNYLESQHSSQQFSKIAVGVMTNPYDISTFDTLQVFDMTGMAVGTAQSKEILFNTYDGEGTYIAFLAVDIHKTDNNVHFAENVIFLDDVEVKLTSPCVPPSSIEVTAQTGSSISLSWVGDASSYQVMYSTNEDMSDSIVVTVNGNSTQLTGLLSYSNYYIKLASVCDGVQSEWTLSPIMTRTAMDCGEGFINFIDTIGNGTSADRFIAINGNDMCSNTYTWTIYTAQELLAMGLSGDVNWIKAISLHTKNANAPLPVRIYMTHTDANEFTSTCTDTIPVSQMTLVYDHTKNFTPNSWNELLLDTPFNYNGTSNLMIAYERLDDISDFVEFYYSNTSSKKVAMKYFLVNSNSVLAKSKREDIIFNICGKNVSCARPNNIQVTDVNTTSLSLSWDGTSSNYQIVYGIENFDPNNITTQTLFSVNTNYTTITGLTPQTTYYLYIRSMCGNEYSDWSLYTTVSTPCDAINTLPYYENFDTYTGGNNSTPNTVSINPCWGRGNNSAESDFPFVYSRKSFSAPNSLAFRGSIQGYSYAALPMFGESVNQLSITFKMLSSNERNIGPLYIGVMSNQNNINTFEVIDSVENTAVDEWQDFNVDFRGYTGSGRFIAFKLNQNVNSVIESYIDNVEVYKTSSCIAPNNVQVSNINANTATITWSERNEDFGGEYEVQYGSHGFQLGSGVVKTVYDSTITLNNLNAGMVYDVYVRAHCSDEELSRWSSVISFSTYCDAVELPVTYDFEAYETGSNADLPLCFNRYNDATSTVVSVQNRPYINVQYSDLQKFAHSGRKYLYYSSQTSTTDATTMAMIFPPLDTMDHPMNENQAVLWSRSTQQAELVIGIMSDPFLFNTFVPIDTLHLNNVYAEYTIPFDSYLGKGVYPTIVMYQGETNQSAYVDDVRFEAIPPCALASDLRVISVTGNSAQVAWTDTIGSTKWIVDYRIDGSREVTSVEALSNPFTISNLTPKTKYIFNVRPICFSGDTTAPALVDGTFCTAQIPATVPYTYDFENETEWANWQTNTNSSANWFRGTALSAQGNNAMYVSNDQGATRGSNWSSVVNAVAYRDIDFGSDTSMFTMTFKANVGGYQNGQMIVGVMLVDAFLEVESSGIALTTPWGAMEEVSLISICRDTNWSEYSVNFENVAGVKRVAFYWYNPNMGSDNAYYDKVGAIDNIHIVEQTCFRPADLSVTNLEATSATLQWNGSATKYEVSYSEESSNIATTQIVQSNHIDVTDLLANTDYKFSVRSICTDGDTSYASDFYHFTTLCSRYFAHDTLYEPFSSVQGTKYNEIGYLPDCWESYSNGANGVKPHVINKIPYLYAIGTHSLIMSAGSNQFYGNRSVLRLPYTTEPVNKLNLTFWMSTESNIHGELEIGYLTGTDWENNFVAVKKVFADDNTRNSMGGGIWDTIHFDTVPANAQVVAFRWSYVIERGTTHVCLDEIKLWADSDCDTPQIQTINSDAYSATITWTGSASNYQLQYKSTADEDWSDIIATNNTMYTLTNLQPETNYSVRLRALCGEDGNSEWISATFETSSVSCSVPTQVTLSEISYENVTIDWHAEDNTTQWIVRVATSLDTIFDTVSSHPTTITGLYGGTTYAVAVRTLCSNNRLSDWSETKSFTTLSCPSVTNISASHITDNAATITWDSPSNIAKWEINYGVDIDQGSGEYVESTETSYLLTNLEEDTPYDVYIRSYCAESVYSEWSHRYTFTTLKSQEGIDGVESTWQFVIYPNPTSNTTTISLSGVEGRVVISVIDMNGRTVSSEAIECGIDCEKRIDVNNLPQGTYFVRVIGNTINSVRKLIVR